MFFSRPPQPRLLAAGLLAVVLCLPAAAVAAPRSLLSDDDNNSDRPACMTDRMVRNFLADQGFTDVTLNVSQGTRRPATGMKGGERYLLTVDTCNRRIEYRGGR